MGWPQVAYIVLLAMGVGIHLANHGQPRNDNYSVFVALISSSISLGIVYAGGFFG